MEQGSGSHVNPNDCIELRRQRSEFRTPEAAASCRAELQGGGSYLEREFHKSVWARFESLLNTVKLHSLGKEVGEL